MKRKLQVFISSTYSDLQEERQAAVSAILKAGHIPAGMELFTSGDQSQMTIIKNWIDESDVYMLILGGRYGSVEKTSGISYTELEYDYAHEQGKPAFAVVITEQALEQKIRSKGTVFGEKENPKELALFRQKVLTNMSSFFDDYKDIKLCVHESLADFSSKRELKGWVSADEVVDTLPLFEEIKKLSEENKALKEQVAKNEARSPAAAKQENNIEKFTELKNILKEIEIKIPATLAKGNETPISLLQLFYGGRDALINGVTNAATSSPSESFFYHNICPKLQVHGLVINEEVPGTRYRRSYVSAAGNAFLAQMEREIHLTKKKDENKTKDKEPATPKTKINATTKKTITRRSAK
ncbi:uncharacterized protein DUF4062 [Acidovorax sp. 94]|uniref:DUF4062 domain-containing protein n=1 Tax=Acidovorax sp. 94 TaxID=2135633 RepID=UPI000EAC76F4|nr:DUF4062 domain-containing protein [Acidovorax sp. 94]RKR66334.1 uncharacterized protein DUF4062 [Acidovorax sp. 94]